MPRFEYGGFDSSGAKITGTLEAPGRRAALETLRSQEIFATEVQELSSKSPRASFRWQRRRIPLLELAAATRQLATLLGAGLPLDEVLASVAEQIDRPALALALNRAREEVVQGSSLYQALEAQGQIFSPLYVNMVKVGESSGTLDQVLTQLADLQENQARTRSRIRAALTYPALMGLVGSAVLLLLFVFVVPQITRMLDNLGMELPLMTRLLIGTGNLLSSSWWLLLLLAILAVIFLRRYARSEKGSLALHRRALQLPLIGRLNLFTATARLSRTLATLLQSGVPLLTALDIARGLISNKILRRALADTAVSIREGEGLAAPLQRSGVFPRLLVQMAAAGEKSGQLEKMLLRAAQSYEQQVELSIAALLPLLEPLMILVMGSVVGVVVMAILLPIFQASQGMG
ncbi:type II secretion system protein GspF [Syntrophotalea acetylenivorans]|uniref:General secretion pathway protein F n=1 Tax=Syntrophotalea acetylenivorans TaxID=1842532 RepID=A0A1L3GPT0_9BACT|nr:type II secretion system inner membrane protein GspF [Syntrophotalea acetylenivorans]APG27913.1 type II secretion system protein GspF [Syntrophotalea acetylenivorans]